MNTSDRAYSPRTRSAPSACAGITANSRPIRGRGPSGRRTGSGWWGSMSQPGIGSCGTASTRRRRHDVGVGTSSVACADGNYSRSGKHYGYYRDEALMRGLTCSEGGRLAVREEVLEQQFYNLLVHYRLPGDFRQRIAETYAEDAADIQRDASSTRRQALESELERVKFQHQHGLLSDGDLLREV